MKRIITLALFLTLVSACAPSSAVTPTATAAPVSWWRNAIFYEVFVRSFSDSNGDGIGDFNGLRQKLDYLQSLGVNALWLMPIHPSPSYHGYDVIDYYAVNPQYGTMDDFKRLLNQVHARGMHIIIDLVPNHTSSQNPWFVDADSSPGAAHRDWYLWAETNPGKYWNAGKNGYYFGSFCDCMPDLNYTNPAVTTEMEKIVRFWLNDMGVDGFRVDAVNRLIEDKGKIENTPATHTWLKGFYQSYKADNPNAYTVGEVFGAGAFTAKTYTGNQLDQIFNFEMASGFIYSVSGGSNSALQSAIQFSLADMPGGEYATFLTNHDQNRVMSMFNGNVNKAKVAASLLLTSPGTPFIYYGEEIGMTGQKPDPDIRLPMQWTADPATAGFTVGKPWRAPAADTVSTNVAAEEKEAASLLNHYRALTALRNAQPALRTGSLTLLDTGSPAVYASLRTQAADTLLILVNLSAKPVTDYKISLSAAALQDGSYTPENLFGSGAASALTVSSGVFNNYKPLTVLPAFTTWVFRLRQ